jgi:hypothetical protein
VPVLDNGPIHTSKLSRAAIDERPWLTVELCETQNSNGSSAPTLAIRRSPREGLDSTQDRCPVIDRAISDQTFGTG